MKQKYWFFLVLVFLLTLACQNDDVKLEFDESTTISSEGELNALLQRSLQNTTTKDNFIDASSAVKIEFPYAIQLDGQNFNLNEEADYEDVISYLESLENSSYQVDFIFPLELSLVNYEVISVSNESDFNALISSTEESSEINCIKFSYPIEINSFSVSDENSLTRIVNNRAQFFNFLASLKQQQGFYQFTYPVNLTVNGQEDEINSVTDLQDIFNVLPNPCFQPNLFEPPTPQLQLENFLLNETFYVFYLLDDGEDETDEVEDFRFTFNANGSISVLHISTQTTSDGTWIIEEDNNQTKLDLTFEDPVLDELQEDWVVEEFAVNNQIRLSDEQDQLIFEKVE